MFRSTLPAQTSRPFPRLQGRTGLLNLNPWIDTALEPCPDTNTYPGPQPDPVGPRPVEPEPVPETQPWAGRSPAREAQPALKTGFKKWKNVHQSILLAFHLGPCAQPGFLDSTTPLAQSPLLFVMPLPPPPNRAVEDRGG